ncbi:MAG: MBL fold metallo-hydrolase [Erysipelotrichia bacterium]|nr:MBL fold metallo-hydrolase [Erysipelotrichia bacterium]
MSKLVYFGHACFLIESPDYRLIIDPYAHDTVPNLKLPANLVADKVICSHDHADHNARHLVKLSSKKPQIDHFFLPVPHDREEGMERGFNNINVINVDGYQVVHLGDTGCVPETAILLKFKNCDVLLAPINGQYTINPQELKLIVEIVNPRIVIPMHYFNEKKQSGYPDGDMFSLFKKEFPGAQLLNSDTLDLKAWKDYKGALIFNKYRQ